MKARSTKLMLPWGLLSMVPIRNGGLQSLVLFRIVTSKRTVIASAGCICPGFAGTGLHSFPDDESIR